MMTTSPRTPQETPDPRSPQGQSHAHDHDDRPGCNANGSTQDNGPRPVTDPPGMAEPNSFQ
jgi:hypothetical protein